ncbi:dTDP-4-dehydrorhamnose reductase [Candidatus Termititenax persephonae]|uniref:dTDP-4-dehydrorhamnose reductase n=1 Tax=Candidatus Termititenax persephonae TaxID=2218525 RepID=A0A388TGV6_9BACT|nr:dTDP-4-dehydrorhamnose reductase [Candidatus Termititenax persephonae]
MKIAVTGARGMLASVLVRKLLSLGHAVLPLDLPEHDLLQLAAVKNYLTAERPEFIYNCAALTDVDLCETEVEKARAINALAAGNLAEIAVALDAPILQISTDYVFAGDADRPYLPSAPTAPLSVYGQTKAEGERLISQAPKHFIVRTAWLYGHNGKNFVETMLKQAQVRPSLQVVDDQRGAPTFVDDFVEALVLFLPCREYGIYHFTNSGETTWYGFAQEFWAILGIPTPLYPCATREFPRPAPRPAYSVLDLTKTQSVLKIEIPSWQDAIRRYLSGRNPAGVR